jgi:hypothetical protein
MTKRVLLVLLLLLNLSPAAAQAAPRCFPEAAPAIADCVDGRIALYWQQNGGLPVFGYPIGPQQTEQIEGGALQAQPFERYRLELHPQNARPYDVLLGRLGADALARQGRDWMTFPKADPAAPHYFSETGHAIATEFWGYWSSHGLDFDGRRGTAANESLALFGLPLSEPSVEVNPTDGRSYLTQWFERARFEYHPENPDPYKVLLGLLQRELATPLAPTPMAPTPVVTAPPGGFIQVAGSQLTRLGQPITLKGVNYYPQWRPWKEMWTNWDGPQTERELRQARTDLGVNAVRVLLPYNWTSKREDAGSVTPNVVGRLREIAQIAGSLDMRLIVTLFDFAKDFPAQGTSVEREHLAYLRALLPNFADDERILAWDIHNEPDNYGGWKEDPQKVLDWLGRMADEVHARAPKQLVTVGMGNYQNLWLAGPEGRRVVDYSDVVSMHTYDSAHAAQALDELRAQTGKPIVVEEFGWPSGPPCVANFSEANQIVMYRDVLAAAKDRTAGVLAWTLRDFDASRTMRWDGGDEYLGMYRADGSLKPSAELFRAVAAPPLPSTTTTNLPLTTTDPHFPDQATSPILIPESGHYVKGAFRRAWELFGGRASLGLPLTEAFMRFEDKRVVQYFEAAVLELNSNPGDLRNVPESEQIMRVIRPVAIGATAVGDSTPPPDGTVAAPFRQFYDQLNGVWRLGSPISAELTEDIGGVPTTVQYFQNGRLELNRSTGAVSAGALGARAWDAVCRAAR